MSKSNVTTASYTWSVTFTQDWPSISNTTVLLQDTGVVPLPGATYLSQVIAHPITPSEMPYHKQTRHISVPSPHPHPHSFPHPLLFQVLVTTPATVPHAYASDYVSAATGVSSYTYMVEGLPAGVPYTVQVTPINAAGSAVSQTSVPLALAPPLQAPSEPLDVYLSAASANSLQALWMAPLSDGGSNVTTYKIEWDLAASFDSNNGAPTGYYLKTVTVNTCQATHCSYVINGLTKGTNYYVRVFAYNALGFSVVPGLPAGLSMAPITQPSAPALVSLQALDAASGPGLALTPSPVILATITPPDDNGGAPVTAYKVEWDVLGAEAYPSVISPADSLLYSPFDVQAITASASAYGMQGYFYLAFGSSTNLFSSSIQVSVTASADDMKVSISILPYPCHSHRYSLVSFLAYTRPLEMYPTLSLTPSLTPPLTHPVSVSLQSHHPGGLGGYPHSRRGVSHPHRATRPIRLPVGRHLPQQRILHRSSYLPALQCTSLDACEHRQHSGC